MVRGLPRQRLGVPPGLGLGPSPSLHSFGNPAPHVLEPWKGGSKVAGGGAARNPRIARPSWSAPRMGCQRLRHSRCPPLSNDLVHRMQSLGAIADDTSLRDGHPGILGLVTSNTRFWRPCRGAPRGRTASPRVPRCSTPGYRLGVPPGLWRWGGSSIPGLASPDGSRSGFLPGSCRAAGPDTARTTPRRGDAT